MREARAKDRGSKVDSRGERDRSRRLTRANGGQESRRRGERRAARVLLPWAARPVAARTALCTIAAMAYDEELACRIRQLIGSDRKLTEKKIFGVLASLIRGNMAIAASSEGGAMVRA
jgi:hypothetical protein